MSLEAIPPGGAPVPRAPWPRRWRTTLLGAFLSVALVVMVALVADVARDFERAAAAALATQHDTAVALARATRLFADRYLRAVEVLAEAAEGRGAEEVRPLLRRVRGEHAGVVVLALDATGRVLASSPAGREGEDHATHRLFRAFSEGARSVVTRDGAGAPGLVVGAAARGPQGALRSVVAAAIPARVLADELDLQLAGGAEAIVVEADGHVLVYGARADLDPSQRDFSAVPLVAEALAGRAARSAGYPSPITGETLMGAMVPVPGLGWAAGAAQPAAVALEPARRERAAALRVAASVLVLSLALALLLSAWLSHPVERLAAGAAAFSRGDFGHRVPALERHELGWLAERFNEMAERLAETTRRLHAALDGARAERRRLATTLESIPDGVLVCDAEGRLVVANEPARRMLGDGFVPGVSLADLGSAPETLSPQGEPVPPGERPLRRALAGTPVRDQRLAVRGPEGRVRYVSATAAPVESAAGERLGAVAVLRDVTDQQALDALKDQFIARASHELRTPLTAIHGTLGLLRRSAEGRLGDTGTELLAMASRNADQMLRLVEDLLDASRLTGGAIRLGRERLAAADLVRQAVRLTTPGAAEAGVHIDVTVDPGLVVEGDPLKLEQVLANLLANAITFTPREGRVSVTAARAGEAVEIRVRDPGPGLAREHLEMVFEPFFRVDQAPARRRLRGGGLGLTVARTLVELHGGRIWAESGGLGQGCTFVVRVPAANGSPASRRGVGLTP